MSNFDTEWYFAEGYESREDIEEDIDIFNASSLWPLKECPRMYYYQQVENLEEKGTNYRMASGSAMHLALDYFYVTGDEEEAVNVLHDYWEDEGLFNAPPPDEDHLNIGHLEAVLKNYFDHWNRQKIDPYKPMNWFTMDDLDTTDLLAGQFRKTDDGRLILGECALIMRFEVDGEEFALAGHPDLPVQDQIGRIYIMDHKTTSSYLSSWFFRKHEVSNKLRGYMAMLGKLLDIQPDGALINGIYVGKHATNPDSNATRFARRKYDFNEASVQEAIRNQYHWIKTAHRYEEEDYWPQGCDRCRYQPLCTADPEHRGSVVATEYEVEETKFFDIN